MRKYFLAIFLIASLVIYGQNTGSFSGRVIDEKTQDPLEGSTVLLEGTNIGVITDANGFFVFENRKSDSNCLPDDIDVNNSKRSDHQLPTIAQADYLEFM